MSSDYKVFQLPDGNEIAFCLFGRYLNERLDKILAKIFSEWPRVVIQEWIRNGNVRINDSVCIRPSKLLRRSDIVISVIIPSDAFSRSNECFEEENIPLKIVAEDDHIMVINKPPQIVMHPARGNWKGTLLNAILYHNPNASKLPRAGIVHRLDKDTSGLIVVAKTKAAVNKLRAQFLKKEIEREYLALVHGTPSGTGKIEKPIGRSRFNRVKMATGISGREAITLYTVKQKFLGFSLLRCYLRTGRTHQLRVHLESIGHPIVGDPSYNSHARVVPSNLTFLKRQALHAFRLHFKHPNTQEFCEWSVPPPQDFSHALDILSKQKLLGENDD